MPSELSMNGKKKIETLQKEFTQRFPYLTIVFLDKARRAIDISRSLAEVREIKGADISINASLKVNTLEKRFFDNYGLIVEVAYQKLNKIVYTKENVDKTLNELNKWCENNDCQQFEFKKSFTGNTLISVQEQLFELIKVHFPNSVAKKINKDNYLDIYIPEIHKKRGTHLYFNTAKDGIRIGFYCRDEEFIEEILKGKSNIEKYAQGVRLLNNPTYTSVEEAGLKALDFIHDLIGYKTNENEGLDIEEFEELADIIEDLEINNDEKEIVGGTEDKVSSYSSDITLLIDELSKINEDEFIEIKLYTDNQSEMIYWIKFEVNKSTIEITRTNWSDDSYWLGKVKNIELLEGLKLFKLNNDVEELVENYLTKDLIDYSFDQCGIADNGFHYEITDITPELKEIPESLQDNDGNLDINELTNNYFPKSEELSEQNIGKPTHYEILINGNIFKIDLEDSHSIYNVNNEEINPELKELTHLYFPKNNSLIEKDYDEVSDITDGLINIKQNNFFGFLNSDGYEIIECKYFFAAPVESKIAFVVEKSNEDDYIFHYFDTNGKIKLSLKGYDAGKAPNNEGIWVQKNEDWSFLDWNGKVQIKGQFDNDGITNFHDGYSFIKIDEETCSIKKNGEIKKLGNFEEFRALENHIYVAKSDDKFAFYNFNGEQLSDFIYDDYENFESGFANVSINNKWGVINTKCELIIPCEYDSIQNYRQEVFGVQKEGKYGFVDANNKTVCKFIYDDVMNFSKGYCIVQKNDKYGIINLDFEEVVKCISEEYPSINEDKNLAIIGIDEKNILINLVTGKIETKKDYQTLVFDGEWILAKNDEKWGFIDYNEKVILNYTFDDAWPFSEDLAKVQISGKYGYINRNGKYAIDPIYQEAENFYRDTAIVSKNGIHYGLINKNGKEISQFIYTEISFENDSFYKLMIKNSQEEEVEEEDNETEKTFAEEITLTGNSIISLGYDSNTYPTENVCGKLPESIIIEALGSEFESWAEFISDNWYEYDNIEHTYGINEPANCALIDDEAKFRISINYEIPEFERLEYYFKNSKKGDFISVATSYEKCYDFNSWKVYKLKLNDEVFYISNIKTIFDNDKVSGYQYESEIGGTLDFEEISDYSSEGKGLDIELLYNNGNELVPVSLSQLREEISEKKIKNNDINSIKKLLNS